MNTVKKMATKPVKRQGRNSSKEVSLGVLIRRARLARKETLGGVSKVLHIRENYLKAIEEDRSQDLPKEMTYSIGFVRSYAQFLGLDPAEIVGAFKRQHIPSTSPIAQAPQEVVCSEVEMPVAQQEKEATHFLMGWVFFAAAFIMILTLRDSMPLPEAIKNALDFFAKIFWE